jgi:hypothetical protein
MDELHSEKTPEPFVDADTAATFLSIERRQLLHMARAGLIPAYPASMGTRRKQWRFRLSELADAITARTPLGREQGNIDNAPRQPRTRNGASKW